MNKNSDIQKTTEDDLRKWQNKLIEEGLVLDPSPDDALSHWDEERRDPELLDFMLERHKRPTHEERMHLLTRDAQIDKELQLRLVMVNRPDVSMGIFVWFFEMNPDQNTVFH